ncbi:hypothetical protein [Azoarcus sp. DN11]|uniref:hypothetical protein n=1 Tax=Azoarcus sp. DN11 TaxID=356837 RepID=UPI000EB457C2|nr:hypothetical protein [Azoarcus sp. DN11]AYH42392.1 hypothetical protein CDA09_03165 [Azoarcus sp. DN11]
MIRTHRHWIARLAVALLLFMQLAVAAYACPGVAKAVEPSRAMESAGMEMGGDCCPTLDPADPNRCLEHGQQDSKATALTQLPEPLGAALPLLAVALPIELVLVPALPDVLPEFLARTTAPPPAISFGVFRS